MSGLLSMLDTGGMQRLYCRNLHSVYLENKGGKFQVSALPLEAQIAPIFGMIAEDLDHDGNLDLLAVGNFYGTDVVTGRYDAMKGLVMLGDGAGHFRPVTPDRSGWLADGDSKALVRIETRDKHSLLMIGQIGDSLRIFEDRTNSGMPRFFPSPRESAALVYFANNKKRKVDIEWGSTYLSQSSRSIVISKDIRRLDLFDSRGIQTRSLRFGTPDGGDRGRIGHAEVQKSSGLVMK
jgi:hypothetical protein